MKSVASHSRRGFTLVELLMVITIIGMLAGLLVVGAMRAVVTAKTARLTVEIGMLDTAVQNYKNELGGDYPPDCTFLGTTTGSSPDWIAARNNRILAHLRKAYPRFYLSGYGAGATQGTLQYAVQKAFAVSNQAAAYNLYPLNGATTTWGDINNLDAAEALVFWLGGLPAPPVLNTSTNTYGYRLIGFGANKVGNPSNVTAANQTQTLGPFCLDTSSRLKGPFEFQEQRLGDVDGDGWPEYYPPVDAVPQPSGSTATTPGNATAPYVYFDGGSYSSVVPTAATFTSYPSSGQYPAVSSGSLPVFPTNNYAGLWGAAIPYASAYNTTTNPAQLNWMNPEKFQIVSAGLDSQYWSPPSVPPAIPPTPEDFRVFSAGTNYSPADMDNVTNFSNGKLQDSMP